MGKYVIKEAKTGFKFDLKATNGQIIGVSEGYPGKGYAKRKKQRKRSGEDLLFQRFVFR